MVHDLGSNLGSAVPERRARDLVEHRFKSRQAGIQNAEAVF